MLGICGVGFIAYIMDGLLIGTGQTRVMHHSMLFSTLLIFLPCWWLTRELENDGLWLAMFLFTLARGVTLGGYWLTWRKKFELLD